MATAKLKRKPDSQAVYKTTDIKRKFRLKFCVVAVIDTPGCCCSSFWGTWADMPTVLGVGARKCQNTWVLRVREVGCCPFSWPRQPVHTLALVHPGRGVGSRAPFLLGRLKFRYIVCSLGHGQGAV